MPYLAKKLYNYHPLLMINPKNVSRQPDQSAHLRDSLRKYEQMTKSRPNDSQGYTGRARCQIQLGKYDDALKSLQKALKLDPRDADSYFSMGYCYSMMKRQKEALSAYNNSLQLRPTDLVCFNIANTLNLLGQNEEALRYYDYALSMNPNYVDAKTNRDIVAQQLSLRQKTQPDRPVDRERSKSPVPTKTVGKLPMVKKSSTEDTTMTDQFQLQKVFSKIQQKHAVVESPTPYDQQINYYSDIIMKDPSSLLAYCYRAMFYLKANRSQQFEADIQWGIWVSTHCEVQSITPLSLEFLRRFLVAYAESVNYLRELLVKSSLSQQLKEKFQTKVARYFIDVMNYVISTQQSRNEDQASYDGILTNITVINNQLKAIVDTSVQQAEDKEIVPKLQYLVQPAIDRFLKQVQTDMQLEYLQESDPTVFEYTVTMSKLLFTYLKSFDVIQTHLFATKNPNANRYVDKAFEVVSVGINFIPNVSPEAEPILGFFKKFVDIKYNAKFRETREKFAYLMKNIINEEKLNAIVLKSVLSLSRHPNKLEEIRAAKAGELIQEKLPIKKKLSKLTESITSMLESIRDQIVQKLYDIRVVEKNPIRLLAVKDLTTFLQIIFRTDMDELPTLENLITCELIDEAYIPKDARLSVGPSVIMNLQTRNCLFSAEQAGLGLYGSRIVIWRFVQSSPDEYLIMNMSNNRFLSTNEKGVYQADACNSDSKWYVRLIDLPKNSRAWIIQPVSFTNSYLTFTHSIQSKLKFWQVTEKPHIEWGQHDKLEQRHYWLTTLRNEP